MAWQIVQLDDPARVTTLQSKISQAVADQSLAPLSDLTWVLGGKAYDPDYFIALLERNQQIAAFAVLRRHPRAVKLQFGEFILYRYPLERFELWAEPVVVTATADRSPEDYFGFLEALKGLIKRPRQALSIEGLAVDSAFSEALKGAPEFTFLELTKPYQHQLIRFPDTFEQYLASMSKRSRKSVQYSQRKLHKSFDVALYCCTGTEHIDHFLNDAILVSKKTYQWNLLGLGLRDKDALTRTLSKWHELGKLRCYLLYCDDSPVAFMLGYVYRNTYYYIDVGFDPDWTPHSVGSVLQIEVIQDIYRNVEGIEVFDFSTGYGEHKGRFGNAQRLEINALLLPKSWSTRGFVALYRGLSSISDSFVAILDKLGVKKRLKKLVRKVFSKQGG